jgi:hypothetical protein
LICEQIKQKSLITLINCAKVVQVCAVHTHFMKNFLLKTVLRKKSSTKVMNAATAAMLLVSLLVAFKVSTESKGC